MELWQLNPLNKYLKFSNRTGRIPGGHQRPPPTTRVFQSTAKREQDGAGIPRLIAQQEMIVPNEQNWFSFFKKDRWFNGEYRDPFLKGQPWSIDHPEIGLYLSIALELANRMLSALIQEQHPLCVGHGSFA